MESDINDEYYNLSEKHPELDEGLRAKLIDWILHCTTVC